MNVDERTVREIMRTDVITVKPTLTVARLMELLEENEITAAPVVAEQGTVEGVVSVADVARAAAEEAVTGTLPSRGRRVDRGDGPVDGPAGGFFRYTNTPLALIPAELPKTKLGALAVRDVMTPATFSVRPDATLRELARFLVRGRIHRALVFEDERLVGIVTSMDLVRAVAESPEPAAPAAEGRP